MTVLVFLSVASTPKSPIIVPTITHPPPKRVKRVSLPSRGWTSRNRTMILTSKVERWRRLVVKYFPKAAVENALQIIQLESGGNPRSKGDTQPIDGLLAPSIGLFQIRLLRGRPTEQQLYDPEFNIAYSAGIFKAQGWMPWTAARTLGLVRDKKKKER